MSEQFDILVLPKGEFVSESREGARIGAIIVHCLGLGFEEIFPLFKRLNVSSHFLVPQLTGRELQTLFPDLFGGYQLRFPDQIPVIQKVAVEEAARHAGISSFANFNQQPNASERLNSCTIGIEFHTPGYANGDDSDLHVFTPYTEAQREVGIKLIDYLMRTYDIPRHNLLAHSTIAPGRKTDPGPMFFWRELHEAGIGYLPTPTASNIKATDRQAVVFVQQKLKEIGFNNCPEPNSQLDEVTICHINSYIMQFAPHLWQGHPSEITQELLDSLNGFAAEIAI